MYPFFEVTSVFKGTLVTLGKPKGPEAVLQTLLRVETRPPLELPEHTSLKQQEVM